MLLNLSSKLHDTILIEEIQRISDGKAPLSQERTYGYQRSIAVASVTAARTNHWFFSASSPVTATAPNRFARAQEFLQSRGFKLQAGNLTLKSDFYRSGTIEERAEEFNQLLRDPNVRCVMSTIGGMNSNALLPYIDYEAIKADPKIIIGYSDTTALLLGIYAKTGLITFYGPALVASFGEFLRWSITPGSLSPTY